MSTELFKQINDDELMQLEGGLSVTIPLAIKVGVVIGVAIGKALS